MTLMDADARVLYDVRDGISVITLNRPDRLNALLPGMGEEYSNLLRRADADPRVRAIVVTGAGRGFCSGADLGVLAEGAETLNGYLDDQSVDILPTAALRIGTPVATAINGPCAGIGFVLAISADARFAHPTATFSTSFSRLGLIAEYGVAWLLTRLVGLATATDLLITGRTVSGDEAAGLGLVNAVSDDAVGAAMDWARDVADNCSPSSIAVIKRQLLEADQQDLRAAVDASLVEMRAAFGRPDLAAAVTAKMEKRPVTFPPRMPDEAP
jgi:enoyl-CoA hydratase/carnithine racemase